MSGKSIKFDDKKVKTSDSYESKKVFKIDDIDADKILVSREEPYGINKSIKYFVGYSDNDLIRPLCIMFPQKFGYAKNFESNKTMSFKVGDNKFLKMCTQIWKNDINLFNIKFDSGPVYGVNDKYIKTKIKIYEYKVDINFQGKKLPKENSTHKYLLLIMLDSVVISKKKYYPQKLLKECKCEMKKTKMENLIKDDFEPSLSDESDNESYNESDNESDNE